MILSIGKSSTFLLLLSLSAIFLPVVSAQNKKPERVSSAESQTKTSETEIDTALKTSRIDGMTDSPDASQPNGSRRVQKNEGKTVVGIVEENEQLDINRPAETGGFTYHFRQADRQERQIYYKDLIKVNAEELPFRSSSANAHPFADTKNELLSDDAADIKKEGFHWRAAIGQSLMFLAIQHGYAFTQPKTREALKGNFLKDYANSVKSLHGWDDGGRFFTNYIAHPMQGSFMGFIQIQNDPKGLRQQFGTSGDYWRSRMKAMAWSAAWSTQFEIGPISQASIGNVGLKGKQTWEDILVTPTLGTAMLISEDAIDRFIMKRIERSTDNFYAIIFSRMLLSPTRTIANLFRFKTPWHRDRQREH